MRKDQQHTTRLDGETAELLDQLARLQGVSHAEITRRAIRLLAHACNVGTTRRGAQHWAVRP